MPINSRFGRRQVITVPGSSEEFGTGDSSGSMRSFLTALGMMKAEADAKTGHEANLKTLDQYGVEKSVRDSLSREAAAQMASELVKHHAQERADYSKDRDRGAWFKKLVGPWSEIDKKRSEFQVFNETDDQAFLEQRKLINQLTNPTEMPLGEVRGGDTLYSGVQDMDDPEKGKVLSLAEALERTAPKHAGHGANQSLAEFLKLRKKPFSRPTDEKGNLITDFDEDRVPINLSEISIEPDLSDKHQYGGAQPLSHAEQFILDASEIYSGMNMDEDESVLRLGQFVESDVFKEGYKAAIARDKAEAAGGEGASGLVVSTQDRNGVPYHIVINKLTKKAEPVIDEKGNIVKVPDKRSQQIIKNVDNKAVKDFLKESAKTVSENNTLLREYGDLRRLANEVTAEDGLPFFSTFGRLADGIKGAGDKAGYLRKFSKESAEKFKKVRAFVAKAKRLFMARKVILTGMAAPQLEMDELHEAIMNIDDYGIEQFNALMESSIHELKFERDAQNAILNEADQRIKAGKRVSLAELAKHSSARVDAYLEQQKSKKRNKSTKKRLRNLPD